MKEFCCHSSQLHCLPSPMCSDQEHLKYQHPHLTTKRMSSSGLSSSSNGKKLSAIDYRTLYSVHERKNKISFNSAFITQLAPHGTVVIAAGSKQTVTLFLCSRLSFLIFAGGPPTFEANSNKGGLLLVLEGNRDLGAD